MLQHINQDWFNEKIRQTEDGKAAVYDLIRNAISGRGERVVWQRLKEQYPEVEALVDSVTFRDAVGRKGANTTPVVDLKGWLEILALLPGAAGKKYRKTAADLVVRVWKGDAMLGLEIMLRDADSDNFARAKRRLRVTDLTKQTTAAAFANNEQPNFVHDARYVGYFNMKTGQVRKEMGIEKNETPLNFMDTDELAIQEAIMAIGNKALKAKGGTLQSHVKGAAKQMRGVYEVSVGQPPALPDPAKVGFMDPKDARVIVVGHEAGQLGLFSN